MGTLVRTKNLFIAISLVKLNHSHRKYGRKKFYRRIFLKCQEVQTTEASFGVHLNVNIPISSIVPFYINLHSSLYNGHLTPTKSPPFLQRLLIQCICRIVYPLLYTLNGILSSKNTISSHYPVHVLSLLRTVIASTKV